MGSSFDAGILGSVAGRAWLFAAAALFWIAWALMQFVTGSAPRALLTSDENC
jgi:hypothetical protein